MMQKFENLVARSQHISPLKTLEGHTALIRCVAFSPDGYRLASGASDGTVRLWEVSTGNLISTVEDLQIHTVYSVAFSPDGHWLACGTIKHTVILLEVATGRLVSVFQEPMDAVYSVAFSPDGHWLAAGAGDDRVYMWEVSGGRFVATLRGHTDRTRSVAFSPDGQWLASGSDDSTIRLWEVPGGRLVSTFAGHKSAVCNVAFSPDGRWLASGSDDSTVRLWEVQSKSLVTTFARHAGRVNSVVFAPNSRVLVSTSVQDATVRLWEIESNQLINILSQASTTQPLVHPLALSPDGCILATYTLKTANSIQLWDISPLDIGFTRPNTNVEKAVVVYTHEMQALLNAQMCTFPLCHVHIPAMPPTHAISWLRGAAAAGWPLPFALAYDLGLLLSQPANRYTLAKPAYLPFDEDTSAYLSCLQRLAAHPLVQHLPFWTPPLSDAVIGILLARLVEGLELAQDYRLPAGPDGVHFLRMLDRELAHIDPASLWQRTPSDARPTWHRLLTPAALTRLERNLQALDLEEVRFLAHYGSSLSGSPDPRTLLDLLALTGLPAPARLALNQSVRFLPQLSADASQRLGSLQTYPEGGYDGLARQGSLESLLPGEALYPDSLFLHRILNHEALYYGRERPRERGRELAYLVGQLGWGLGDDGQVLVRSLLLALSEAMRQRGYQVFYSFAGANLSDPHPLEKPEDVGRILHAHEQGSVNSEIVLRGVLEHLRTWHSDYRRRHVFWILSEDFDWDSVQEHSSWYRALRAEGEQQVWYIRVGCVSSQSHGIKKPPVTADAFGRWQIVESGCLWNDGKVRV